MRSDLHAGEPHPLVPEVEMIFLDLGFIRLVFERRGGIA
jgi:hypothetical protein